MTDIIILMLPTIISVYYLLDIGKKIKFTKLHIKEIKFSYVFNMVLMIIQIITIVVEPMIIGGWMDTTFEYGAIISTIIWIISIPLSLYHKKTHDKLQKLKKEAYDKLVTYCNNCGYAMSSEIKYCTNCGKKLEAKK